MKSSVLYITRQGKGGGVKRGKLQLRAGELSGVLFGAAFGAMLVGVALSSPIGKVIETKGLPAGPSIGVGIALAAASVIWSLRVRSIVPVAVAMLYAPLFVATTAIRVIDPN